MGTRIIDHVHPEDRDRTSAASERVMGGNSHIDFENRYICKDGRVAHILWSARWSAANRVRIAVARDVTALKQAENMRGVLYRISEAAHATESLATLCREIHRVIDNPLPADRFYVALYDSAEVVIGKIHKAMAVPMKVSGNTLTLSVSIGVASYPDDGEQAEHLVRHADAYMYAMKRGARIR